MRYLTCLLVFLITGLTSCQHMHDVENAIATSRLSAEKAWQTSALQGKTDLEGAMQQPVLNGELTLTNAVALAMVNNKQLARTLKQIEVVEGQIKEVKGDLFPAVELTGGYTRLDQDREAMSLLDNYELSIRINQLVYNGGALRAAVRAAKIQRQVAKEGVSLKQEQTVFNTVKAYVDALLARELVEVKKDAVTSAKAHLRQVTRKLKQNVATEYDQLRAKVDVAVFQAEMLQERNNLNLSKTALLRAMGVSQDSDVTLVAQLAYQPVQIQLQEALAQAQQKRVELRQAQLATRAGEELYRIEAGAYKPRVNLFATETFTSPDAITPLERNWGDDTMVGLSFNWTLFAGGQREGALEAQRAELEKAYISLYDTRERIRFEVRQAYLSVQDQQKFVESQQENIKLADRGLKLVQSGAEAGVNTRLDITDARNALTRAKGLYYQALHAHLIARLRLQKAMGELANAPLDEFVQEEKTP